MPAQAGGRQDSTVEYHRRHRSARSGDSESIALEHGRRVFPRHRHLGRKSIVRRKDREKLNSTLWRVLARRVV